MTFSEDFIIKDTVLIRYTGKKESVTIPDGVTAIGEWSFSDFRPAENISPYDSEAYLIKNKSKNITGVVIPESVISIGDGAFYSCSFLEDIEIPDSVTSIGEKAFEDCTHLKKIILGKNIKTIGYKAFSGCEVLTEMTIPEGVTMINDFAFACSGLKNIRIPESMKSISSNIFFGCRSLASVYIGRKSIYISKGFVRKEQGTLKPEAIKKLQSSGIEIRG